MKAEVHYRQNCGFSSGRVQMWELDCKEDWVLKNWYFWIVVLEKTLKSPLDSKEIKPIDPKGNQLWIFIGRTDAEAPMLWPPDAKSRLIGKDPDTGKDWRQKEKWATEDEMVRSPHQLHRHEFEQTPGASEGTGKPGVLQSMGSQTVGHDLATDQQSYLWAWLTEHKLNSIKD